MLTELHPFGPIESTVVVGYYRRGEFRPCRVRIGKGKAVVFELPNPQFDRFYASFESRIDVRSEPMKDSFRVQTRLDYSVNSTHLWNFMEEKQLGYQLTFVLKGEPVDRDNSASWPESTVEIINCKDECVRCSCKVLQSHWRQLLEEDTVHSFLRRFPKTKRVQVRVTREYVTIWDDHHLCRRLTRLKPFNDQERRMRTPPSDSLDPRCLSILDLDEKARRSRFCKYISQWLMDATCDLKNLENMPDAAEIKQRLTELNQMVEAIEFLLLKPFYETESFNMVPFKIVVQMVKTTQMQIQRIIEGNLELITDVQASVMMLFLSAKNLIDGSSSVIIDHARPKLETRDPETVTHERFLYWITTPGLNSIFESLLRNCDILGTPEHLILPPDNQPDPKYAGRTKLYTYHIDGEMIRVTQLVNGVQATHDSIPIPRSFKKWWLRRIITILFDSDTLVFQNQYSLLEGGILDILAALQLLQKKKKVANTKCWLMFGEPKLDTRISWSEMQPVLIFDKCLLVPISQLDKLTIGLWSWKEQSEVREWVVQHFENPFEVDDRNTTASIPMRWRGGQLVVLINQTAFLDQDETLTQLVVFWKCYKSHEPEFWFDQNLHLLKVGALSSNTFSWIEKRRRLFLLSLTLRFNDSSLHYLHDRKFVRIADAFGQAPGFARLLKSSHGEAEIRRFAVPDLGVGLARHMKRVSEDNRTLRQLVTVISVRF